MVQLKCLECCVGFRINGQCDLPCRIKKGEVCCVGLGINGQCEEKCKKKK